MLVTNTTLAEDPFPEDILKGRNGLGEFSDITKYPLIMDLCYKIQKADKLLRKLAGVIPYIHWNDPLLCEEGWNVATMRHSFIDHNPLIPFLMIPEVRGADFARLEPGAHIIPHTGYLGDSFRLHYGMDIPEGDCALRVGNQIKNWEAGKFFMFNDLDVHEAWNRTESSRLIFMLEIDKSALSHIEECDVRV